MSGKIINLEGKNFGRLTVFGFSRITEKLPNEACWVCRCVCGLERVVRGSLLRNGSTQSCGCLQKERTSISSFKHGKIKTRSYGCWVRMIQRCTNSNIAQWKDYGGRGIQVCEQWLKFENFFECMGECPPGKSLDRYPDKNGNYEPGNVRWATPQEQARHRRNSVMLNGKLLVEWAEITGIRYATLQWRVKNGWPIERILQA